MKLSSIWVSTWRQWAAIGLAGLLAACGGSDGNELADLVRGLHRDGCQVDARALARDGNLLDEPRQVQTAFALEAVLDEVVFVVGPVLVTLLATSWHPVAGLTTALVAGVVFFVIFLYTKFYDWWWDVMPKYLFFLVIALVSVLLLLVFQRLRRSAGKGAMA